LKVGLATEEDGCKFEYLSDKTPKVIEIKPGTYHGYKAIEPGSILLYYVTRKYDPDDEIRADVGHFGENWNTENK
jgi:dTDP-4-dehydrorhamnose 3,5-epimerase-like enzyme